MKNDEIDQRLRELAKESEIAIPQNYEQFVDQKLDQLCKQDDKVPIALITSMKSKKVKKQQLFYAKRLVATAASIIILFNFAVIASSNYMYMRMDEMSEDEKEEYVDDLQSGLAEADGYSRPLSEVEEERLAELKKAYETEGMFPEGEVLKVTSEQEVQEDVLCFVTATSKFYIPERDLTDEELLGILDFYYKRDYSLAEHTAEQVQEKAAEIADAKIAEAGAVGIARKVIKDIYGVEFAEDDYVDEIMAETSGIINSYNSINFPKANKKYKVSVNAMTGDIQSISYTEDDLTASDIAVNEEEYIQTYEEIKVLIENSISRGQKISKAYVQYLYNTDNVIKNGVICYYIEMENGNGYTVSYSCKQQKIYFIFRTEDHNDLKSFMQIEKESSMLEDYESKITEL